MLYLSKGIAENRRELEPVYRWLVDDLKFLDLSSRRNVGSQFTLEEFESDDPDRRHAIIELLQHADLGVNGAGVHDLKYISGRVEMVKQDGHWQPRKNLQPFLLHQSATTQSLPLPWNSESAGKPKLPTQFTSPESEFLSAPPADLSPILALSPSHNLQEKTEVLFEGPVSQVGVGGHGRYLVFYFPHSSEVKVFDLATLEFLDRAVKVGAGLAALAAGAENIVVVDPQARKLHRIALATLEIDQSVDLPWKGKPFSIEIGRSAQRLAAIGIAGGDDKDRGWGRIGILDIDSMSPLGEAGRIIIGPRCRASADGRVWSLIDTNSDGQTAVFANRTMTSMPNDHLSTGWPMPSLDGTHLLTSPDTLQALNGGVLNRNSTPRRADAALIPSGHPAFYLRYLNFEEDDEDKCALEVVNSGEVHPLVAVDDPLEEMLEVRINSFGLVKSDWDEPEFALDRRFHLIPQLKLLATLPPTNDRLILRPFDLEKEIANRNEKFLYIDSVPGRQAKTGTEYRYQIGVRSSADVVTCSQVVGPPGLKVSEQGMVSWTPQKKPLKQPIPVAVRIEAGDGMSRLHSFDLTVE